MRLEGRVWRVEQTIPSPHTSYLGERQFTVVSGEVNFLSTTRSQVQSVSSLKMMFFTEERVPGNASTEITTNTPDGSYIRSSRLDTAVFSTDLGNFSIFNRPGMLVVTVVSPEKFPAHFEMRIVETLSFLLAKPLAWDVLELVEDGLEIVHLRGAQRVVDAKLQPPISTGTIDMSAPGIALVNNGTLAPGASPGTLTIIGDYVQSAGGSLAIELGGTKQGVTYDWLKVTGNAMIDGNLKVLITGGFTPTIADNFQFITTTIATTGTFSSLTPPPGYGGGTIYGSNFAALGFTVLPSPVVDTTAGLSAVINTTLDTLVAAVARTLPTEPVQRRPTEEETGDAPVMVCR